MKNFNEQIVHRGGFRLLGDCRELIGVPFPVYSVLACEVRSLFMTHQTQLGAAGSTELAEVPPITNH